ncbi:MAG: hypothetical protein NVS3B11_03070 [Collimonas sp.]
MESPRICICSDGDFFYADVGGFLQSFEAGADRFSWCGAVESEHAQIGILARA